MLNVSLDQEEWTRLLNILGNTSAPWVVVNPLLMKIGRQLQEQQAANPAPPAAANKGKHNDVPAQSKSRSGL